MRGSGQYKYTTDDFNILFSSLPSHYVDPNGCWKLVDHKPNPAGYYVLHKSVRGKQTMYMGHRVFYQYFVGEIPTGLVIDHLCRNKACVNPKHLEPVTSRCNVLRGNRNPIKTNVSKTHCLRGHEFSNENTYRWVNEYGKAERTCKICRRDRDKIRDKNRK